MYGMKNSTIVAISTARGRSAIAVVRMSGENAIEIAKKFFEPMPKQPNMLKVGTLHTANFNEYAMCVYFVAPFSYTGENTVEFHCHGGNAVCQAVVETCLQNGAIMAQNGEFSKRAFINGKQNLTNAEGIIEMIDAETASAAKAGANLLENKLGKQITQLQDKLTDVISQAEATLDYPEEDLEAPTKDSLQKELQQTAKTLKNLVATASLGKVAKYGINVAIIGKTNVGKSSLLNALLGSDRAIVSGVEGTTRDILTESVNYKDIKLNFIDTAGIRETTDVIEAEGVRRAKLSAENADVVLYVTDDWSQKSNDVNIANNNLNCITVYNKSDLHTESAPQNGVAISALQGTGINELKEKLYNMFNAGEIVQSDLLITNERHLFCLKTALDLCLNALDNLPYNTLDVCASEVREIWQTLGEITGTTANEEIIDRIYSKFCLGK